MPESAAKIRAIIADDEAPSRALLISQLSSIWPELSICGLAKNGLEAKSMIETLRPDCAFLDIKMPGISGMEVACQTAGMCRVVFITAYDEYAVDAFENEAVDYILKPALDERLKKTVSRLKALIASQSPISDMSDAFERLVARIDVRPAQPFLQWIRVQVKDSVILIPSKKICLFKASNGYTAVITASHEYLIRKTITELAEELDPGVFFRIHRGTIVNAHYIEKVCFLPASRGLLTLKGRDDVLAISRSYSHIFKQM